MKAELLGILPEVTDREWAGEFSDQLENLLVEVGGIFPRADAVTSSTAWTTAGGAPGPAERECWWSTRPASRRRAGPRAGVARQYPGTLGGVFPCQAGVMAAWATGRGQALADREVYLRRERAGDRARCRAAHVPDAVALAARPRLAGQVIARIAPSLPGNRVRVAADEACGRDGAFRALLEENHLPCAVNVQASHAVLPRPGWRHAARLAERHAAGDDWVTLPAGPSQLDSRVRQWRARHVPAPGTEAGEGAWARRSTARRRPEAPAQRDCHVAWGPPGTAVEDLARVPGARWRAEEAIKLAKSAAGMADYEVRSFHGWYRHITLAQLAAAFLAVQAATAASIAEILHASLDAPAQHTGEPRRSRQPYRHRPHRIHGV